MATPTPGLRPMSDAEFRWRVTHTGKISGPVLKITTSVLLSLALVCLIGRLTLRFLSRRRLYLDDGFLCLAAGCLCGTTAILFQNCFTFFLTSTIHQDPSLQNTTAYPPYLPSLSQFESRRNLYTILAWTTLIAVKFCFFAFFKPLIRCRRKIKIWYWFSVAFTVVAWALALFDAYGFDAFYSTRTRVFSQDYYTVSGKVSITLCVVDIVSDLMIVSIPILLLRPSTLRTTTKIGVGTFLCLSLFMVICSLIRAVGFVPDQGDVPSVSWRYFWLQIECCTAVIMGSVTVFRTVLVGEKKRRVKEYVHRKWIARLREWPRKSKHPPRGGCECGRALEEGKAGVQEDVRMPTRPSPTFMGFPSFIRRGIGVIGDSTFSEEKHGSLKVDYNAVGREQSV
ncbi:hypothetical protein K469DRAFT_666410 [Zopfia rhizophila CBS 207.26]|uniref:Rhodopsin domain-containing protein n=1 Tax=Zopfia rhizophila CBS 207.26 TaxID=1314779 RepID=A0A6A6E0S9_9PEZI|nr:hypothetical protein K469DRAFT_666410 [Zopfia rhizophila CBS 207.26]